MVDSSTQTRAPSSQAAVVEGGFITAGMHTCSKSIYQTSVCVCVRGLILVCILMQTAVEWDVCRAVTYIYLHVLLVKDTLSPVCVPVCVCSHAVLSKHCVFNVQWIIYPSRSPGTDTGQGYLKKTQHILKYTRSQTASAELSRRSSYKYLSLFLHLIFISSSKARIRGMPEKSARETREDEVIEWEMKERQKRQRALMKVSDLRG